MADPTRYSLEHKARFRLQAADQRRHFYYATPLLPTANIMVMHANGWLNFLGFVGSVFGVGAYLQLGPIVRKYTLAHYARNNG